MSHILGVVSLKASHCLIPQHMHQPVRTPHCVQYDCIRPKPQPAFHSYRPLVLDSPALVNQEVANCSSSSSLSSSIKACTTAAAPTGPLHAHLTGHMDLASMQPLPHVRVIRKKKAGSSSGGAESAAEEKIKAGAEGDEDAEEYVSLKHEQFGSADTRHH